MNFIRSAFRFLLMAPLAAFAGSAAADTVGVTTVEQLVAAVDGGGAGDTINLAAGTYELPASLKLKSGMTLQGAGAGQTIVRNAPSFAFPTSSSYDSDIKAGDSNRNAYLIDLGQNQNNMTLRGMTLTGPELYGGVHAISTSDVTLTGLELRDFRWSGVRSFSGTRHTVTNNAFIDAGGQTVRSDGSFGQTGGSIFNFNQKDSLFDNNRFEQTDARRDNVYGIKGRIFKNTQISNNTIRNNFAIELPFENDEFVEINNNLLEGAVSVPKFAGGPVPDADPANPDATPFTFDIHHNYFTRSFSLEGARNGMIVRSNVFDIDVDDDRGNLYFAFDPSSRIPKATGPYTFTENVVLNPGRGVFASDVVQDNLTFTHNHIIADETDPSEFPTGLFGFRPTSPAEGGQVTDFDTILIADNIIEVLGSGRPLLRNLASGQAQILNNMLTNLTDGERYLNPQTGELQGLTQPLLFRVGVNGELLVDSNQLLGLPVPTPAAGLTLLALAYPLLTRRRHTAG